MPCASTGSLMLGARYLPAGPARNAERYGNTVYGRYGFADAFTPKWSGESWIDPDVVGIDVGISLLSLDNLQTGNTWRWFMHSPYVQNGLRKARFRGAGSQPSTDWSQRLAMRGRVPLRRSDLSGSEALLRRPCFVRQWCCGHFAKLSIVRKSAIHSLSELLCYVSETHQHNLALLPR